MGAYVRAAEYIRDSAHNGFGVVGHCAEIVSPISTLASMAMSA
jgi:hypothetical protein